MIKKQKRLLAIITFLVFVGLVGTNFLKSHLFDITYEISRDVNISQKREVHILYGDNRGGGHLYGIGKPCKSEFPKDWDEEKIITTVKKLAANDNVVWSKQRNGYFTSEQMVDDLNVRVVLDKEKDDVITAYPVNVTRNPCDIKEPANDNFNE